MIVLALWRKGIDDLRRQRFFVVAFVVALALVGISATHIYWQLFPDVMTAQIVPLHYNIHFGIDHTGSWWQLFVPSAIAFVVTLGNFAAAVALWRRERVLAYAFAVAALAFDIVMAVGSVFVVFLNLLYA